MIVVDLDPIAQHLEAEVTELITVGLARNLGSVTGSTLPFPSAHVIPLRERAGDPRYAHPGALSQSVSMTFGVVLALRDIGGGKGATAMGEAARIRADVMTALARFRLPGADDVCIPTGGQLVSNIDNRGRYIWQDDYRISFHRDIDGGST